MASTRALWALPARASLGVARAAALRHTSVRFESSSSTSALAYKALHRRISPLPTTELPSWSAPAAVSSILYETPMPSQAPPKRHILNCLVQNEPGVLSRVSGILAARGFNIDSLVVCNTEVKDLSRMTIVLQGQDGVVEQARRQLEDLVPIWTVLDYTQTPLIQRELLLAKISILGPEFFEELLAHHREISGSAAIEPLTDAQLAAGETSDAIPIRRDFHPSKLAVSQALRHKHEHLEAITHLTHQFGGKVLDISDNNCVVELSAKPMRIDSFMKLIAPFGILESARTGESTEIVRHGSGANTFRSHGAAAFPAPRDQRGRGKGSAGCGGSEPASARLVAVILRAIFWRLHRAFVGGHSRLLERSHHAMVAVPLFELCVHMQSAGARIMEPRTSLRRARGL